MHPLTLLAALLCPGIVTATGCTLPATLDQRQNSGRWTLQPQARKPTPVKWRHDRSQSRLRCNGIRPRGRRLPVRLPASGRHYRGERGATPHAHPTSSLH